MNNDINFLITLLSMTMKMSIAEINTYIDGVGVIFKNGFLVKEFVIWFHHGRMNQDGNGNDVPIQGI